MKEVCTKDFLIEIVFFIKHSVRNVHYIHLLSVIIWLWGVVNQKNIYSNSDQPQLHSLGEVQVDCPCLVKEIWLPSGLSFLKAAH